MLLGRQFWIILWVLINYIQSFRYFRPHLGRRKVGWNSSTMEDLVLRNDEIMDISDDSLLDDVIWEKVMSSPSFHKAAKAQASPKAQSKRKKTVVVERKDMDIMIPSKAKEMDIDIVSIGDHSDDTFTYKGKSIVPMIDKPRWFKLYGKSRGELKRLELLQALAAPGGPLRNILIDYYIPTHTEYEFSTEKTETRRTSTRKSGKVIIKQEGEFVAQDKFMFIRCSQLSPIIPVDRRIVSSEPGTVYILTKLTPEIGQVYQEHGLLTHFHKDEKRVVPLSMEATEALLAKRENNTMSLDTSIPPALQPLHKYCYVKVKNQLDYPDTVGQLIDLKENICEVLIYTKPYVPASMIKCDIHDCIYYAHCTDESINAARQREFKKFEEEMEYAHFIRNYQKKRERHEGSKYLREQYEEKERQNKER